MLKVENGHKLSVVFAYLGILFFGLEIRFQLLFSRILDYRKTLLAHVAQFALYTDKQIQGFVARHHASCIRS